MNYRIYSPLVLFLAFILLNLMFLLEPASAQPMPIIENRIVAKNFILEDQDEKLVELSDFKGKVVIVNFWATWCPPCRKEMPSMQRAWEILEKEDIKMLAINVGEDSDAIFAFTAIYPVEFPLLMDKDSSVYNEWKIRGLPSTYIIDPEGKIAYKVIGSREWDAPELLEQIRALKK